MLQVGFGVGDIKQVDDQSNATESGPEHADRMGMKLAGESSRVVNRMAWLGEAPMAAAVESVPIAIRSDPERERPPFGLGSDNTSEQRTNAVYANERKLVAEERKNKPKLSCEVQGLRVGPLGIVTNGAEYFCEHSLRIKKASRHPATWVVTLANEWIGYVPTAQAFGGGGGYEPRIARSSKLAPDAGQLLVEGALKALTKVLPQDK
jgi:hypothetical protein